MKKTYLKWVGGKTRILPQVIEAIGDVEGTFFDVFGGSGVVALNVKAQYRVVNDLNDNLIACHKHVVADWKPLSFKLQQLSEDYLALKHEDPVEQQKLRKEYYTKCIRNIFNNLSQNSQYKAAMFLGLNRLGFNGLWRVNADGENNVSVGKYNTVYTPNFEMKQFATEMSKTEFTCMDFEMIMQRANRGDCVYIDPPYLKANTSMTDFSYCEGGFDVHDHKRLAECIKRTVNRGVRVVVSNADTPLARELYKSATKMTNLAAHRSISCKGGSRGLANELLCTWYGNEKLSEAA